MKQDQLFQTLNICRENKESCIYMVRACAHDKNTMFKPRNTFRFMKDTMDAVQLIFCKPNISTSGLYSQWTALWGHKCSVMHDISNKCVGGLANVNFNVEP